MIPLAIPNLSGREAAYLQECITSGFVSSVGPFVDRFEQATASATGSTGAVATASGTAGLHLALTVVGVRPGDLVIVPSFTFIASANAIAQCGAVPWLFDISDESWTLDPAQLERELSASVDLVDGVATHRPSGRHVAAVMPVYAMGTPADMDPIVSAARARGIPVVADAAAAIGARYRGRNLGGCADVSVASFNGNKTLTCGGGGALFGNDLPLLARARHLSTTARVGPGYDHDEVGFNYRLTNIQAAVGCAQFEQLDQFLARKASVFEHYSDLARQIPGASAFPSPHWAPSAHWFSGIVLDDADRAGALLDGLRQRGVDARPFWKPVHLQAPFRDAPAASLAHADGLWRRVVALPSSTSITDDDLGVVSRAVLDALA
jgi:dTDP-4-amino-4,6-dideoxygalactose transaminase